jgi:hypothetical protein
MVLFIFSLLLNFILFSALLQSYSPIAKENSNGYAKPPRLEYFFNLKVLIKVGCGGESFFEGIFLRRGSGEVGDFLQRYEGTARYGAGHSGAP